MATSLNNSPPAKRSSWLRKLAIVAGVFVVLVIVLYFAGTSSAFLKASVLPRVGKAIGADLNAAEVSLSPLSQIVLKSVRVQTTGTEPLLTAEQVKVRYNLFAILRGNIELSEVSIVAPVVNLVTEADGKSNLDPLLQRPAAPPAQPAAEPVRLDLKNLNLKNAKVRMITKSKDGASQTIELQNLSLSLDQLRNGGSGNVNLSSEILFEQSAPSGKAPAGDRAQAKLNGEFAVGVDQQLMPGSLKGAARFELSRAEGAFQELAGLSGSLQADTTMTEIRQLALKFERGGQQLGSVVASGPFNLNTLETRLQLEVHSIDRQVLNLAGAAQGWDFADSVLNSTNHIEVTRNGSSIAASGTLAGNRIGLRQGNNATPPLNLNLDYQVSLNLDGKSAVVQRLNLTGTENQRPLIEVTLDRPMSVNWGAASASVPDSTLRLSLHDLNLQSWQAVLGTNVPGGRVNLQLGLETQQNGKKLGAKLTGEIQDLAARVATNQIDRAQARFQLSGQAEDLRVFDIDQFRFELLQNNRTVASSSGSIRCDLAKSDFSLKTDADLSLTDLLKSFPIDGLNASSGQLKLIAVAAQNGPKQSASGQLVLTNFTGRYADYQLQNFQTSADYELEMALGLVQVRRANATFAHAGQPGGRVDLAGQYHLTNGSAQISFRLADVNQHLLRPFLAASLGDMQLASISVNGSGSASRDPKGDSVIKADVGVTNLVVADPLKKLPRTPLSARVQLDGSVHDQSFDLRQVALTLSPTARAKNELQLKGRIDLSPSNAAPSQLSLQAESLDLTPYYDLFAGTTATNPPTASPQVAGPGQTNEPSPMSLPIQQMTADLKLDRCFLRDIALTNFQASARIDKSQIAIKPFQFSLNGAPVNATAIFDVGVPGYKYDVSLTADRLPLGPLASSFGSASSSGLQGVLIANAQIKGAGVTGAGLQRNLAGKLALSLTNMNYEIVGRKTKALLEPIALVLRLPELTLTPLEWVNANADVGQGRVNVSQFSVFSQALSATGQGTIQIAPVLTNSLLDIPVAISLRRSLAEKANLTPAGTPPEVPFVQLPTFAKLAGTMGEPKTEIDKLVVSGLLLRSAGGIPKVGDKAGNLLQGIGDLLSGQKPGGTATNLPSSTNSPAGASTNKPSKFNPLDLLDLLPKKK